MSSYVVIKLGGHALDATGALLALDTLAEDVNALRRDGVRPVVVHGAGPQITAHLAAHSLTSTFRDGLRATDDAAMTVVAGALSGVNLRVVAGLSARGVPAWGVAGPDGALLVASARGRQYGRTGGDVKVSVRVLTLLADAGFVPVVNPVAVDEHGELLNCNADEVAGAVAHALQADALILLSDIDQVLTDPRDPTTAVAHLSGAEIAQLHARGALRDGMGPKVAAAQTAVRAGAARVVITNGTRPHALRRALDHEGLYTEVTA